MHRTYVLQSIWDGRWYTGHTGDRRAGIDDQLKGRVEWTHYRRPLLLIYYESATDARRYGAG